MELKPFEGIDYEDIPNNLPSFESIILSVMAKSKSHVHSMNFFNEPGITDFPLIDKYYDVPSDDNGKNATKGKRTISKIKKPVKTESNNGFSMAKSNVLPVAKSGCASVTRQRQRAS